MWAELYEEYAYYNVGVQRVKHVAVELFAIIYLITQMKSGMQSIARDK